MCKITRFNTIVRIHRVKYKNDHEICLMHYQNKSQIINTGLQFAGQICFVALRRPASRLTQWSDVCVLGWFPRPAQLIAYLISYGVALTNLSLVLKSGT